MGGDAHSSCCCIAFNTTLISGQPPKMNIERSDWCLISSRLTSRLLPGASAECREADSNAVFDCHVKARLHGSPMLINAVESTKLNSTVERYCLHSSTKVNEAVDFKMAANELVREGVVVICEYLMKECKHVLEKKKEIKRKKTKFYSFYTGEQTDRDLLVDTV